MKKSSRTPCSIQILTGPPRSGKTRHILQQTLPFIKENRCSEVLVLVPSNLKAEEVRNDLLDQKGVSGFLGLKVLTFLDLTHTIFQESRAPGRVNSLQARRWMVQSLLEKLPVDHFGQVRETRGILDLCTDFIRTLKEAGIPPEEFQKINGQAPASPALSELAKVYQAYEEERIKRNLMDREDLFTLSAQFLHQAPDPPFSSVRNIMVTGFYDFTPLQLQLLSAFASLKTMQQITVTLQYLKGRGPGRQFTQRSLDRLRVFFPEARITSLEHKKDPNLSPLEHLSRHFLSSPEESGAIPSSGAVEIIHTPGSYREVEEMARKIRDLIHGQTYSFKDVAVVFRNLHDYQEMVREIFRFYRIPLRMASGMPLRTSPLVQALMGILEVPRSGFQREAVIRLLRSAYLRFEPLVQSRITAERIDALAREAMIYGRKQEWKSRIKGRIQNLGHRVQYLETGTMEDRDPVLQQERIDQYQKNIQDYTECEKIIEALFSTLSSIPGSAPLRKFIEAVNGLIQTFQTEKKIYASKDLRLIRRDQQALKTFQELLNQMLEEHETLEGGRKIKLSEFVRILNQALSDTSYTPDLSGEDAVLVTDALGMRELHRPVVLIGGLVEESFPRAHSPNPFFGDEARKQCSRSLGPDRWIPLAAHWREEEELLFVLAASGAADRLILTYPRTDSKGREILASRYMDRVQTLFTDGPQLATEVSLKNPLPDRDHLFRHQDLLEHTFYSLYRPESEEPGAPALFNHVMNTHEQMILVLLHGLGVIRARKEDKGPYQGILDPKAAALIRKEETPYSVTALEKYGACAFQYFCERILKVQPPEEVEDEINVMDMGSLYHRILERFYRNFSGPVTPHNLNDAREKMHATIDKLLTRQEFQGVPGHQKLWEIRKQEVRDTLDRFLEMEKEEYEKTGEVPTHFEVSFGMPPSPKGDPLSTPEPLIMESDSGPIHIMGKVDRIDLSEDKDSPHFSIIDYKTGKTAPSSSGIAKGESLQLPVYGDWVQKVFSNKRELKQGSFYLLKSGEKKRQVPTKKESTRELWDTARKHIQNYVASIRKGEFPAGDKKCADFCRYHSVCRIGEE